MAKYTSKCSKCGASDLAYNKDAAGKWALYPARNDGGEFVPDTSKPAHVCPSPAIIPVTVAAPAPVAAPIVSSSTSVQALAPVVKKRTKVLGVTASWEEVLLNTWLAGARRILAVGPPGTGKSTTARILIASEYAGQQVEEVTITRGTKVEELQGCWVLEDGKTSFREAAIPRAMRAGRAVVVNEVSHAQEEIIGLLYDIADDNACIALPTGERLRAKEGFGIIMTDNDNLGALPAAIADRIEVCILATTPHPATMATLPATLSNLSMSFYRALDVSPWEFVGEPTSRNVRNYHRLQQAGTMSDELCAKLVFGKAGKEMLSAMSTSGRGEVQSLSEGGR